MRRILSWTMFVLLLVGTLALAFNVGLVRAQSETIIINSDGSVSPSSAPISSLDNITYTFTGDISYAAYSGVVVERNNIIIDGNGYALQTNGSRSGSGVYLGSCANVTVRNMQVTAFGTGIYLWNCANCTIWGNNLTSNSSGIFVGGGDSSYNDISSNNITGNQVGIGFEGRDMESTTRYTTTTSYRTQTKPLSHWAGTFGITVTLQAETTGAITTAPTYTVVSFRTSQEVME